MGVSAPTQHPEWLPEPSKPARRLAAEAVALGVAWTNLPLPLRILGLGLTARLLGVNDLLDVLVRYVGGVL